MKADNKKRDLLSNESAHYDLEQMSEKQIQDLDWKHPDFRWRA